MSTEIDDISLDQLIESFDGKTDDEPKKEMAHLSLYVSAETKKKFDDMQEATKKKFGKRLQKVVEIAVAKAKAKTA